MTELKRTISPTVEFTDAAFDPGQSEKFCLVAEVSPLSMELAVLDNITNDFLAFAQYVFRKPAPGKMAAELGNIRAGHPWLGNGFKRTDVMVATEKFTLVPSAFFDSSAIHEMLAFNHPVNENEIVLNDILRNADARIVYAVENSVEKELRKISGAVRIRHHFTPLIESFISANKNRMERKALAHVHGQSLDIVIAEKGKLLLANTFTFRAPEDFIYYLLFCCEQLKMNPETMELEIAGELETDSAVSGLARKYVRNVHFSARPPEMRFTKGFEQFPPHYFRNLFSLHYFS
ncbi:MAG TPA: DUF3822 family protein [Bacteroidia bacterium]|nr:DUF3822 family protein [Bacteroidia bacterium]